MNDLPLNQNDNSLQWINDLDEDLTIILENYFEVAKGEEVICKMLEYMIIILKTALPNEKGIEIFTEALNNAENFIKNNKMRD